MQKTKWKEKKEEPYYIFYTMISFIFLFEK